MLEARHMGYNKTLYQAKLDFCWLGMRKDVKKLMKECQVCQVNKYETSMPAGLLQPLPIPNSHG